MKKTRIVAVRLQPEEFARLAALARRTDRSVSGVLRALLAQAMFVPADVRLTNAQDEVHMRDESEARHA